MQFKGSGQKYATVSVRSCHSIADSDHFAAACSRHAAPLPFPQQSANCWLDCVFSMSFNICAILFAFHLICNSICPKSEPISKFYFRNFSTLIEVGNTTAKCQQLRCCCSESMYVMRVCVCV